MQISEIFHSIQGEGSLAGVPSVFVRTSGCNLRCSWCDTPYASWNPEGRGWSMDEIIAEVQAHRTARHVVLTGGEPMIATGIRDLASALKALGYHITIETAATVAPDLVECDLASLSPKLLNSAPEGAEHAAWRQRHESTRWQPDVVRSWLDSYDYQLKFVLAEPGDLEEVETMLAALKRDIPRHRVWLMPEGVTTARLRKRAAWLGDLCKAHGYRYGPRLQIELYGNRRGT